MLCYNPPKPAPMTEPSTPLMRQYAAVKKDHPTALLFFRLGDFYELFFDDAIVAAKELQITLTSRNKEKGIAVPMCGVPYHAAEGYIGKLIRKGFKVAICEQMEDPRQAKKLVRREVTRVVTPGTAADSSLGSDENNFLAALAQVGDRVGFAALDLVDRRVPGDGVFGRGCAAKGAGGVGATCGRRNCCTGRPRRCLRRPGARRESSRALLGRTARGSSSPHDSSSAASRLRLAPRLRWTTGSLRPIMPFLCWRIILACCRWKDSGWPDEPRLRAAAGAILYYVRSTQRGSLDHVDRIGWYERQNCLVLDAVTVRNLELIEPLFAGTDAGVTLFRSIDGAVTPMGKRLLRAWLLRPSLDLSEIHGRLDAVEAGVKEMVAREELRRALDGVLDLERLLSRVTLETANPRDVLALAASLGKIPAVQGCARPAGVRSD